MYSISELKQLFKNEQVFIILLSRLYFDPALRQEVDEFVQLHPIDYKHLYKIASIHNIRPLLFDVISANNIAVDDVFFMQLKNYYLQNQLRSMEQLAICNSLQEQLSTKNIFTIPFKGTVFAYSYYGNIGLRESTDIDLLVLQDDVQKIENHFKEKKLVPKVTVPSWYLNYYKRYFKEIVYTAPAKTNQGYSVEIHWKALNYYFGSYPDFSFFKDGLTKTNVGSLELPVLLPTYDFIAVASNHFIKDMAVKFKYLVDIACLIHKTGESLDSSLIESTIEKYNCRKKMEYGLFLVERLLGGKLQGLRMKYTFPGMAASSTLQSPLSVTNFNVTSRKFLAKAIQLQDNFWQKIRFISRCTYYFFLPTDNDLKTSKSGKIPVLVLAVIRPLRLSLKAIASFATRK